MKCEKKGGGKMNDVEITIREKLRELVAEASTLRDLKDAVAVLGSLKDEREDEKIAPGVVRLGEVGGEEGSEGA